MPPDPGSRDCPWSLLVVAALRSVANADRGPRLRRRGPGFEASPIRIPIRLEKDSGENWQWNIVKDRMAVSKLLRPFDVCSMVRNCMAVSKLLRPSDVCSMVASCIYVSNILRSHNVY